MVDRIRYHSSRMSISSNTMFRAEQSHQINVGCLSQQVDIRNHIIVHSGGIGNKSHTFPFQHTEVLTLKHLDACLDTYFLS